jgi:hypothetical protein
MLNVSFVGAAYGDKYYVVINTSSSVSGTYFLPYVLL